MLYSFGACTLSSVIPALVYRADVAVVDRGAGACLHSSTAQLNLSRV